MIKVRGPNKWMYIVAIPFIGVAAYAGLAWGDTIIQQDLEAQGLKNVEVSFQAITFHLDMACSGKHPTIRHFKARKDGIDVEGTACYQAFTGTKYWIE